jgi:hypothetical protein
MKFKAFVAWYDGWCGYFYDQKRRVLYLGFPPCVMWSFASDPNVWDPVKKRWNHPIVDGAKEELV